MRNRLQTPTQRRCRDCSHRQQGFCASPGQPAEQLWQQIGARNGEECAEEKQIGEFRVGPVVLLEDQEEQGAVVGDVSEKSEKIKKIIKII